MRPVAWSSSYLFRWPLGISTVTSNCTRIVWPTTARRVGGVTPGGGGDRVERARGVDRAVRDRNRRGASRTVRHLRDDVGAGPRSARAGSRRARGAGRGPGGPVGRAEIGVHGADRRARRGGRATGRRGRRRAAGRGAPRSRGNVPRGR